MQDEGIPPFIALIVSSVLVLVGVIAAAIVGAVLIVTLS